MLRVLAALVVLLPVATAISPPRDHGPLLNGSLVVRSLDAEGYEAMLNDSDVVWIVDYYSSWCAHCRMFAPEWQKVGDFYAQSKVVQVGAVDCKQHKSVCTREEVYAVPAVKAHHLPLGTNEKVDMEVKGRKKVKSVVKWVEETLAEHDIKSGMDLNALAEENNLRRNELEAADVEAPKANGGPGDDTSIHMKYKRLRDAGKAVMLSLENSFFMGMPVLEGERYDAAVKWVNALAATFPIEGNRAAITNLADALKKKQSWSLAEWNEMIASWGLNAKQMSFPVDLFDPRGNEDSDWAVCKTYTCGLWTLFHSMTARNTITTDSTELWKPSDTMAAIRLYVKFFFGCQDCQQHFMEANPESLVEELAASDTNGPHAVVMWAWKMHNTVNKRLKRDQWPSTSNCPSCYIDIGSPVSIGMSLIHEYEMVSHLIRAYGHEDKALFEVVGASTYPFEQDFSTITAVALLFALVAVVLKRHRSSAAKDSDHLA